MAFVADAFQRSNGSLGVWWKFFGNQQIDSKGLGGILISGNNYGPSNSNGGDALAIFTATTFANDQWAQAQISAIAPMTSIVNITACTASAGTSTYTYTLTSGAALSMTQPLVIKGMTNAGNNLTARVTGLGAGTFSVANASPGANESGSTGTGTCPSDSNCGLALRCTLDGLNAYYMIAGTNSYDTTNELSTGYTGRVYDVEIWKVVNGVGTNIAGVSHTIVQNVPDSVGDIYGFTVKGTTLTVLKNGVVVLTLSDSSLTSGYPGIWTWSMGGPNEFNWANWQNAGVMGTPSGNNGTQWTNFQAGDTSFGSDGLGTTQIATSNFAGSGDLHTTNPNWSYIGTGAATVSANKVTPTTSGGAKYSATLANYQYAQIKIVTIADGNTVANGGPSICNQNTNDRYFVQVSNSVTTGDRFTSIKKSVSGVTTTIFTSVGTGTVPLFSSGDVAVVFEYNGIVSLLQNGLLVVGVKDTALSGGIPGYYADVAVANLVMSTFSTGNIGSGGTANVIPAFTGSANSSWLTVSLANGLRGLKH